MGFSILDGLVLLTLVLIVFWVISLCISRTYTPILIASIPLLLFGFMLVFTMSVPEVILFGYPLASIISTLGYISLALGVFGIFLVVKR